MYLVKKKHKWKLKVSFGYFIYLSSLVFKTIQYLLESKTLFQQILGWFLILQDYDKNILIQQYLIIFVCIFRKKESSLKVLLS